MYVLLFALSFTVFFGMSCRRAAASDEAIAEYAARNGDAMLKDWLEIIAIPGKSRQEQRRTEWFKAKFQEAGLEGVTTDDLGNVWGTMKGNPGRETILVTGHMDSVFADDTPLEPELRDGWIYCPGASDDVPAPLALVWIKKALDAMKTTPAANLIFLATVQEEIGLKGMKHYLANAKSKPDMVIAVDGQLGDVVAGGLGIHWHKVYANTPAGHTLHSTGRPSAVKSLALAVTEAYKYQTEQDPVIYLNLGVIGGGTTENAICEEAWVTLDMRSADAGALQKLEEKVFPAMEKAITSSGAAFRREIVTDITAAQMPGLDKHRVVQTAVEVLKKLNYGDQKITYSGATDGNISIAMGIPTVSVGIVHGENWHSLKERAKADTFVIGLKQLLMMLERLK
ncbi:MAG: M20/M25/M40 family metallo-hydrolase [Synergistaceae bacterium]|jgi:acetylornithine deacetylase/succinyl-diaminopimelate desuccinylase-like protein|nr:M20/M25/M40 family metallo-hydrolase [Synergistaceae bacterium]